MKRLYVVALALLLSGCGGDPPPAAPPPPSPSPSHATAAAPEMPEGAKEDSREGANAFVRYYVDLINHAQLTGNTATLARLEEPGCGSCNNGRKFLNGVYSAGGHILEGQIRLKIIDSFRNRALPGWTIDAALVFGPQTVVRPWRSPSNEELNGGRTVATYLVKRTEDRWAMADWSRSQ